MMTNAANLDSMLPKKNEKMKWNEKEAKHINKKDN